MKTIENETMDQERALYGQNNILVRNCRFEGPADGESALKECQQVTAQQCWFALRYPLWHVHGGQLQGCTMTEGCRAALWYDTDISISNCQMNGIKAVRECENIRLEQCTIHSPEFGWQDQHMEMKDCQLESEYAFLHSRELKFTGLALKGKYSFQYVQEATLSHCNLDTKDAFWHSRNVTVTDSVIKGEYLGWYSENLHLIRCQIIGTQPLCYATGLILEDCEMVGADLAFENSQVEATLRGEVISVKNPLAGHITADHIGEIIQDAFDRSQGNCVIQSRK